MKFFIAIVAIALFATTQAFTDESKEKITTYIKDCTASTGVDSALVEKAKKGDYADDAKFKNYLYCFYKKADFINDANEFQVASIVSKLTATFGEETSTKLVGACVQKPAESAIETSFALSKCFYATSPNHVTIDF